MSGPLAQRFWSQLERRLPWLGTPGAIKAVVLMNALTFLLVNIDPAYAGMLALVPEKIMQGEVWRLVSYIFVPETRSWFWVLFLLLFMWFLASALEETWGALKLNVFYLVGMLGCTFAAFFFGGGPSNTFLNLSLFFAFATVVPDYEIFLFFVLRVKVKYVAWVLGGIYLLQLVAIPLSAKMAMIASLANYLLFFAPGFVRNLHSRQHNAARLQKFKPQSSETMHRCKICGRTELSDPLLDFRVARDGHEYCTGHLPTRQN
jgi:membrane associated rhomboid family serine protease